MDAKQKSNNMEISENRNEPNNTMSQEARVRFGQQSISPPPSTVSDERPNNHPAVGGAIAQDPTQKPKKATDPLPPTPNPQVVEGNSNGNDIEREEQLEREEENPYDVADSDKGGSDNIDGIALDPPPPPLPGGSYAKVSRVPDHLNGGASDTTGSYAEISQVKHSHVGRLRSSTEPVEPLPPLPPLITKPRTFSGNDSSHLPTPPTGVEHLPPPLGTRTPEVLPMGGFVDDEKVYDSLDDDNEMYESVPEDLKEELTSLTHSTAAIPVPVPRSPKGTTTVESFSGSPSPTKHPFTAMPTPDSPTAKKAGKKEKGNKKRNSHIEDDPHTQKKTKIFNRFRSNSAAINTNATKGNNKKEKKGESSMASPDHSHLSQPIPPVPMANMYEGEDEDDDNGMYDSVDRDTILQDVKLRASTLPVNMSGIRTSVHFSPRVAEPLPEVPEDSGSGSKDGAGLVQRKREQENDDPNYDVVTRAMGRGESLDECDEEMDEDNYDTVRPRGDQQLTPSKNSPSVGHSYAKVGVHGVKQESVSHDDRGYALVDPSVLERKRTASLTKTQPSNGSHEEKQETADDKSSYDRIKNDDTEPQPKGGDRSETKDDVTGRGEGQGTMSDEQEEIDEPPYDKIVLQDDESPYDRIEIDDDEPPYDKVRVGIDGSENIGNKGSGTVDDDDESPYEKVRVDIDGSEDIGDKGSETVDEPPYEKVRIGIDNVDGSEDIDKGSGTVDDDEPPYEKVRIGIDNVDGSEDIGDKGSETVNDEDPGYASVGKFGNDSTTEPNKEEAPPTNTTTIPAGMSFNFEVETITVADVQDTTYSHVNLTKKHELRKLKEQSIDDPSIGATLPTNGDDVHVVLNGGDAHSPTPDIEDGLHSPDDGSEPPPLPSPFAGTPGTMTPCSLREDDDDQDEDPNYDVVKPRPSPQDSTAEDFNKNNNKINHNGSNGQTMMNQDAEIPQETEEQTLYDTLDAKPSTPIYDTLEVLN